MSSQNARRPEYCCWTHIEMYFIGIWLDKMPYRSLITTKDNLVTSFAKISLSAIFSYHIVVILSSVDVLKDVKISLGLDPIQRVSMVV